MIQKISTAIRIGKDPVDNRPANRHFKPMKNEDPVLKKKRLT
jgi:hypothetical protein